MHFWDRLYFGRFCTKDCSCEKDWELREKISNSLFKDFGNDTTTAISMFLFIQAVASNGFPFEVRRNSRVEFNLYEAVTEEEMLAKLECSRKHCTEGRYSEADVVVSGLSGRIVIADIPEW